MADQRLRLKNNSGGLSDDDQYGPEMSFSEGLAIDARQAPGILTLQRRLQKESGSVITTEIHDAVRINADSGAVMMAGGTKIYKRLPGNNGAAGTYEVSSDDEHLANVQDLDYRPDIDALFLIDNDIIHELSPIVAGTPVYSYDKYRQITVNAQTGTGGTYALPSQVDEAAAWTFELEKEPVYSVNLTVADTGTGDWTVVLHDGANHTIGTAMVQNSLITDPGFETEFVFGEALRGKLGASYHVHVYSSDGTGAVQTSNTNTLQTVQGSLKASRLVDTGNFGHPTIQVGARTLICNEKYLAEWEPLDVTDNATSGYDPHRLVFPAEVISIGFCEWSEYTMIACALKRSTDSGHDGPTEGIIFGWNNTDDFVNFKIPVPQGVPNSLFSINNTVHWEAGGTWYRWAGGDPEPVYQFPGVDRFQGDDNGPSSDSYLRAGRHVMAANPNNTITIGFPYATSNMNSRIGLFSFGKSKAFMPPAISYDGLISTGSEHTNFAAGIAPRVPVTGITLVKRFGTNLLVAWKDIVGDTEAYGVDYVNDTSPAATRGVYGSLWFDNGDPDKEKTPKAIKVVFREELPAGCRVTPFIQYDRETARVSDAVGQPGDHEVVLSLDSMRRFYDALVGVVIESDEGNFPYIKPPVFKFDDNRGDTNDTENRRDWPSTSTE